MGLYLSCMNGEIYVYDGTLQDKLEDLSRVSLLTEPALRNLLITQRYHDLSRELGSVLGGSDANWSTFACWASKTAGQSIRKEEVPPELLRLLNEQAHLEQHLRRYYERLGFLSFLTPKLEALDFARAVLEEVSEQIALGNLRVYAELCPLFARFVAIFDPAAQAADAALDASATAVTTRKEAFDQFLAGLVPGPAKDGGQDDLRRAFLAYAAAADSADPCEKAQLILYGNALIGYHEQTRLQQNIAGALNAPFSEKVYRCFERSRIPLLGWLIKRLVHDTVHFMAREFSDDWQRIATRYLMRLTAPNGTEIPLGSDLPPAPFDPLLAQLSLPQLIEFLTQFDTDISTTKGSGAINWTRLDDRMKFIAELFRVGQRQAKWFEQPFSELQVSVLRTGKVPPGRL